VSSRQPHSMVLGSGRSVHFEHCWDGSGLTMAEVLAQTGITLKGNRAMMNLNVKLVVVTLDGYGVQMDPDELAELVEAQIGDMAPFKTKVEGRDEPADVKLVNVEVRPLEGS